MRSSDNQSFVLLHTAGFLMGLAKSPIIIPPYSVRP